MHADPGDAESADDRCGEPSREATPPLGTAPLDSSHRISDFTCPKSPRVERFLKVDCQELLKHNYCQVFVWPDKADPNRILGYYSISSASIARKELSGSLQKKVPGGIPAPVVLIGYMGKTDGVEKGFGRVLIYDAALRVAQIAKHLGIWGLALDAENDALAAWYEKIGFSRARERPLLMYARLDRFLAPAAKS